MAQSEKFWNRMAKGMGTEVGKTGQTAIDACQEFLRPTYIALDFGCGSGAITRALAPQVASITGIDTSAGMIDHARNNAVDGESRDIAFQQVSIFSSDFHPASFDVIFAFNVLHYIADMPQLMHKVDELLRPGGLFISSTVCLREKFSFVRFAMQFFSAIRVLPKTNYSERQSCRT